LKLDVKHEVTMIKVLIVDDSKLARLVLMKVLTADPEIRVIGTAANGEEALRFLEKPPRGEIPDVVTMDMMMPGMDGFEATRKIMETHPLPIVITTSSYKPQEVEKMFRAIEAGAVTILEKPGAVAHREFAAACKEFSDTVKVMAGVKVVRRWPRDKKKTPRPAATPIIHSNHSVLAMGASTGGTGAFQQILTQLPGELPAPIMMVQHIAGEFIPGMIQWLEKTTGFPVHLARAGEKIQAGHVYIAPDDFHMGVMPGGDIELSRSEKEEGVRPSVSYLFRSVARVYGKKAIGVLLTGMGRDGGQGLKVLRDAGALTIAQDESTSTVFGMPAEAIKLGGAQYILPLKEIPIRIQQGLGLEPRPDNSE